MSSSEAVRQTRFAESATISKLDSDKRPDLFGQGVFVDLEALSFPDVLRLDSTPL